MNFSAQQCVHILLGSICGLGTAVVLCKVLEDDPVKRIPLLIGGLIMGPVLVELVHQHTQTELGRGHSPHPAQDD